MDDEDKIIRIKDGNMRITAYPYKNTFVYHLFMSTEDIEDLKRHMSKEKYDELQHGMFSKLV